MVEDEEAEVTPEERAESHAIANRHLALARRALALVGLPHPPVRKKRRHRPTGKIGRSAATPRSDEDGGPTEAETDLTFARIAQAGFGTCRRADCRRAFACMHGQRRGDGGKRRPRALVYESWNGWLGSGPPCWKGLPEVVRIALPLAVRRRMAPQIFRKPSALRFEASQIRTAETLLKKMEAKARPRPPSPAPDRAPDGRPGSAPSVEPRLRLT